MIFAKTKGSLKGNVLRVKIDLKSIIMKTKIMEHGGIIIFLFF